MDVYIKVEEGACSDFSSCVSSTVSPLGPADSQMTADLGFDPGSTDFGMALFDDKKTSFFDPVAPMAEPVSTYQIKKEFGGYSDLDSVVPTASVVTSGNDVSNYITSPVVTSGSSPTDILSSNSLFPNTHAQEIAIRYEQKHPESSTSPQRKYFPSKGFPAPKVISDQSFAAADSNSSSTTKSFVPCKVCGDKASGYHYGVTSCEGCKGFFRRSIQKQIEYRCLRDGKCLVIRLNRNRCQFCRFKKCLGVGMSRDSVRYGRVPKRSRERNEDNRVTQSEADQSTRDIENKELAMYNIILTVNQAHRANCDYTEEKTRGLVRRPAIFSLDEYQTSNIDANGNTHIAPDSLEQQKIEMWQQFAVFLTPSIQRIVEFAKKVCGFPDLDQNDQLILIKSGFFEIWLVHISRLINPSDNTVTFNDGSYVTRQQLERMFDYEFVSALFNFVVTFNNLQLGDTEIGLFSAIVLLMPERSGICDHKTITQHQEKLMEAVKLQVGRNYPGEPHMFATLMIKLPELRSLGTKHMEHLEWFRANWTRLKIPPLFAEIFDIPICDEVIQQ